MRERDLADSSLASTGHPDMAAACDSLSDRLREAVAPFIPAPDRARAFAAIDAVLPDDEDAAAPSGEKMRVVFETLRAIYGDSRLPPEVRRQAVAAAIGANDPYFGESYEYYANNFGVTRACIHSKSRDVQKRLQLRARRDKSDSARKKSKANATGPRRERAPATEAAEWEKRGPVNLGRAAVQHKTRRSVFSFFPGV